MSHPETKTVEIPFVKKSESDLPRIKLTYNNNNIQQQQKMKNFLCMIILDI